VSFGAEIMTVGERAKDVFYTPKTTAACSRTAGLSLGL